MRPLAIVVLDGDGSELRVSLTPTPGILRPLRALGATSDVTRTEWTVPCRELEPLLSLLDRRGYHWAIGPTPDLPRTWAERLFAEVPADCHPRALGACRWAFADHPDHLALLERAYEQARNTGPGAAPGRQTQA